MLDFSIKMCFFSISVYSPVILDGYFADIDSYWQFAVDHFCRKPVHCTGRSNVTPEVQSGQLGDKTRTSHIKLGKGVLAQNKICCIRPNIERTCGPQGFSTPSPILFITLPAFNYEQDLISEASSLSCGDTRERFHPTTLQNKKKFSMPTPLLKCFYTLCRYPLEIFAFLFIKTYPLVARQIGYRRHA